MTARAHRLALEVSRLNEHGGGDFFISGRLFDSMNIIIPYLRLTGTGKLIFTAISDRVNPKIFIMK